MAKICVIGLGHVGLITAGCFASLGHMVIGVDKDQKKVELLAGGVPAFFEPGLEELLKEGLDRGLLFFTTDINLAVEKSDIVFICVGTPPGENGLADLAQVEEVARIIAGKLDHYKLIIEKSTVPAGTAEKIKQTIKLRLGGNSSAFEVASNPEFLREGSAVNDFLYPDRVVIGVEGEKAGRVLRELYSCFNCQVLITDIKTAELIKHASNSFLALKISYINLMADICEKLGADVDMVADGMGFDSRIGRDFLYPGAGYGGSCFPKDVRAFAAMIRELGLEAALLEEVERINQERVYTIVKKIEDVLWVCKNKSIAVLGLAFKGNTDDIRESPGIKLIKNLIKKGSRVQCYDPRAMKNAGRELKGMDGIVFAQTAYEALEQADALVLMTEWPEFTSLDYDKVKGLMNTPVIIDARNMLRAEEIIKKGFWYCGVGRYSNNK